MCRIQLDTLFEIFIFDKTEVIFTSFLRNIPKRKIEKKAYLWIIWWWSNPYKIQTFNVLSVECCIFFVLDSNAIRVPFKDVKNTIILFPILWNSGSMPPQMFFRDKTDISKYSNFIVAKISFFKLFLLKMSFLLYSCQKDICVKAPKM